MKTRIIAWLGVLALGVAPALAHHSAVAEYDLDKPVKFVVNGTPHERTLERNAPEMIKNQYFGGDWGRVFTVLVNQDL